MIEVNVTIGCPVCGKWHNRAVAVDAVDEEEQRATTCDDCGKKFFYSVWVTPDWKSWEPEETRPCANGAPTQPE